MYSMTGYGRASAIYENLEITIEAHSVNRKALDANFALPREWQLLEGTLLSALKERVQRGRVVVNIQAQFTSETGTEEFDAAGVGDLFAQLKNMSDGFGVPFEANADLLFQLAIYAKKNQLLPEVERVKQPILDGFSKALDVLLSMRESEGGKLKIDLRERTGLLSAAVNEIRKYAGDAVVNYREILFQRLRQADLELDLEDERVLKEIALFADRSDISEEITRLSSHLDQLDQFLEASGAIGRKIDFLLQEMNREINTIGSKANDIRISRQVIEFKNELERFREQIANIE